MSQDAWYGEKRRHVELSEENRSFCVSSRVIVSATCVGAVQGGVQDIEMESAKSISQSSRFASIIWNTDISVSVSLIPISKLQT